jgi:hypothetical protein
LKAEEKNGLPQGATAEKIGRKSLNSQDFTASADSGGRENSIQAGGEKWA